MRKTESQKIALCGMLGALSVVLLLLGSALQIGTYAAPMLAAFLLIPVLEEYGTRYALTLYVCVAILAVPLCAGDRTGAVLRAGHGVLPRAARQAERRKKHAPALDAEVHGVQRGHGAGVSFAVCAARARRADELLADGIGMLAALLAAGNLSFWLCDRALAALTRYYHVILKPKLKKKF